MGSRQGMGFSRRPDFMVTLGLLPPYSLDDVRQAYKTKARTLHPDAGGDSSDFVRLRRAYDQALEYVDFRRSRRDWLSVLVERYVDQENFLAELQRFSPDVEIEDAGWRERSFGDFAQVANRVIGLRLNGGVVDDTVIDLLRGAADVLQSLRLLDLGHSLVTDAALNRLPLLHGLLRLDLRNTHTTGSGLACLSRLPVLESLHLGQTRVRWWSRMLLQRRYPRLIVVTEEERPFTSVASRGIIVSGGIPMVR